jgi:predicted HTH transcriptional regulator
MIQACKDRNLPLPEFTSETGNFIARMRQQVFISALPHYHNLNQRQQGILRYVRETGQVTTKEYLKLYGIGERQAHRDLDEMVQHDFFVRVGAGRSSNYQLVPLLNLQNIIWDEI